MNRGKLERLLNSVGKKVFIDYYDVFGNLNMTTDDKLKKLPETYKESASRTRVSCANRIFEANAQSQALKIIIDSRTDCESRKKAKVLLHREKE